MQQNEGGEEEESSWRWKKDVSGQEDGLVARFGHLSLSQRFLDLPQSLPLGFLGDGWLAPSAAACLGPGFTVRPILSL